MACPFVQREDIIWNKAYLFWIGPLNEILRNLNQYRKILIHQSHAEYVLEISIWFEALSVNYRSDGNISAVVIKPLNNWKFLFVWQNNDTSLDRVIETALLWRNY